MKKIFILIMCFFICGCTNIKPVMKNVTIIENEPKVTSLKLSMVGDTLIHKTLYKDAYQNNTYDFSNMLSEIKDKLINSDINYYNAETIYGGKELGYSGYPRFNTPKEFHENMIALGFNVVSLANNHTLDMGETGIKNSTSFWKNYNHVLTSGSSVNLEEAKPKIMAMNDITYTLLSYTLSTNGLKSPNEYYVNEYSKDKVKHDLELVKDKCDLIIVAMHWGDEYSFEPNNTQKEIATFLAEEGVNIVIGTHPHVVEPIEFIKDTLVIYSLGNFISGQTSSIDYAKKIGLLVSVEVIKTQIQENDYITLKDVKATLLYTYENNFTNFKVYPFSKLDNNILNNYKYYKDKYSKIVKKYNKKIVVE